MWQQEQMWTEAWTLLDCVHVRVCVCLCMRKPDPVAFIFDYSCRNGSGRQLRRRRSSSEAHCVVYMLGLLLQTKSYELP